MKTILHILIILMSTSLAFGQTSQWHRDYEAKITDSLFVAINEYRTSKSLKVLKLDTIIKSFTKTHSTKMADQCKNFHSDTEYSECIDYVGFTNFAASSYLDATTYIVDKGIVKHILNDWIKSKSHNKILLKDKLNEGAVYVIIKLTKGPECFPKGSNVYRVEFFATYIVK